MGSYGWTWVTWVWPPVDGSAFADPLEDGPLQIQGVCVASCAELFDEGRRPIADRAVGDDGSRRRKMARRVDVRCDVMSTLQVTHRKLVGVAGIKQYDVEPGLEPRRKIRCRQAGDAGKRFRDEGIDGVPVEVTWGRCATGEKEEAGADRNGPGPHTSPHYS